MLFSLVIQVGCDRTERRLVGFWPTKRRAVPSAPELDGHVTPCWVLQSNLRLLYGNHQEISDLRNLRRFRAPEQRSPLTC